MAARQRPRTLGTSGAGLVNRVLEQLFERRQVADLDLLCEPRIPEDGRIAGQHPEQRLAIVGVDEDRPALLELGEILLVIRR